MDLPQAGKMSPRSPSLSEGEIVSEDEEKAISTSTNKIRDSKVNSSTRLSSESSSRAAQTDGMWRLRNEPNHHFRDNDAVDMSARQRQGYERDRSRSRSPYRASKPMSGEKRGHEDDHYNRRDASDPRRFKVHYESRSTPAGHAQASRRAHVDLDRNVRSRAGISHDDEGLRDRERASKPLRNVEAGRDRSRSPFRHSKLQSSSDERDGSKKEVEAEQRPTRSDSVALSTSRAERSVEASLSGREFAPTAFHQPEDRKTTYYVPRQNNTKSENGQSGRSVPTSLPSIAQADPSVFRLSGDAATRQMDDENVQSVRQLSEAEIIEERRKRREAIKSRHKNNPPLLVQALQQSMPSAPATPIHDSSTGVSEQQSPPSSIGSPQTPSRDSPPGSPAAFAVNNDEELVDRRGAPSTGSDEDGPSAADYDPNLDMQEDRPDHKRQEIPMPPMTAAPVEGSEDPQDQVPKAKDFDMFADDDDDDMFAPGALRTAAPSTKEARALDESLLDNWDYPDGHYRIILGELLDGRYAVEQQIGKGTFATVVRAQDTRTGSPVAVKIACNNETMQKAGQKEMDMLQLLNQQDPEDRKHIIRLLRSFYHKGHLCLVFENLSADLREVLKKFGRNVGLNLKAIRSYAQQMFLSLSHMKKCQILHADLKPDNILVSEKRSLLKVCDLGTAAFAGDAEVTPYLVSRFYRAPEVILGIPFDYAIDMWAIGCTLFELYTGRILFAGSDNNQMLRAIQECRGKLPIRMLKRSSLAEKHFDLDGNFFSQERDKVTGKATLRQVTFNKTVPGRDLRARLSANTKGMKADEVKEHAAFVDLMDKCLQLDPVRRLTPNDALRHGFVAHTIQATNAEKAAPVVKVAMKVNARVK